MERGWVKSYRKIEDWEWYKKPLTAHLFQHLIRRANRSDKRWQGYIIPAGCLVTSIPHLSDQTGLSMQEVKTALKHLYSSKDVEKVTDRVTDGKKVNFTVLKVVNYALYQDDNRQSNRPLTDEQPTSNRPLTDEQPLTRKREVKKERSKEVKRPAFDPMDQIRKVYQDPDLVDAWNEFFEMRKLMKKPVCSPRAVTELINKLNGLSKDPWMQAKIIDQSTERCWQSFYPLKDQQPASEDIDWSWVDGGDKGNV